MSILCCQKPSRIYKISFRIFIREGFKKKYGEKYAPKLISDHFAQLISFQDTRL